MNSSFPYTLELDKRKDILAYLDGIYTSIVLKDIVKRKKIADVAVLESVIRFMFDNIGNLCSATRIANTLRSGGKGASRRRLRYHRPHPCEFPCDNLRRCVRRREGKLRGEDRFGGGRGASGPCDV